MNTTLTPLQKVRLFICFPVGAIMNRQNEPITFSLSAGQKFPSSLVEIMNATRRYIDFQMSDIEGVSNPRCEGDGCECKNCDSQTTSCRGTECKNFTSSIDGIECNPSSCTRTNNVNYKMFPMLPPSDIFLGEYTPRFRFIRYIPSSSFSRTQVEEFLRANLPPEETMPPVEDITIPDLCVFSVTYPSIKEFNTEEKFQQLKNTVSGAFVLLRFLKEDSIIKHNQATLKEVLRVNGLSLQLMQQNMTTPLVKENYRENLELQNLVVPTTSQDDTDSNQSLLTDIDTTTLNPTTTTSNPTTTTSNPTTTTKQKIPVWAYLLIALFIICIIFYIARMITGTKTKKR